LGLRHTTRWCTVEDQVVFMFEFMYTYQFNDAVILLCVIGGFPVYVGEPEEYMHLRRNDLTTGLSDEKNAIVLLNELYYESAVYQEIENKTDQFDASCLFSVAVDGITTYGRGSTRKEAKANAARAAIEQLRCVGILQKRIAAKESIKAGRKAATDSNASEKPAPYRHSVCSVGTENAIAKLNHHHHGLAYNVTNTQMIAGQTSYTIHVNVNGQDFMGIGRSKKAARLAAAESALRALNMWTADDEAAKKLAQSTAAAAHKARSSVNTGAFSTAMSSSPRLPGGVPRRFSSAGTVRGGPAPRGRGMARGAIPGQGSFSVGQTLPFPSAGSVERGHARGPAFRVRGSGMLTRGTRGAGRGGRGAATNVGYIEVPTDKNPVMLLNEVYYSAAEYEYSPSSELQPDDAAASEQEQYCIVKVDGITAYGTGPSRKDAKLNAAIAAVQQLSAAGILQKRLADKAAFMSQKHIRHAETMKRKQFAARRGTAPSARMQRGRPGPGRGGAARGRGAGIARGRGAGAARGRGAGVARGRGLPGVQSFYPKKQASADFNTDFTSFEDASFTSFEDSAPSSWPAAFAAGQYRDPRVANSGRRPGRMANF